MAPCSCRTLRASSMCSVSLREQPSVMVLNTASRMAGMCPPLRLQLFVTTCHLRLSPERATSLKARPDACRYAPGMRPAGLAYRDTCLLDVSLMAVLEANGGSTTDCAVTSPARGQRCAMAAPTPQQCRTAGALPGGGADLRAIPANDYVRAASCRQALSQGGNPQWREIGSGRPTAVRFAA